MAGVFDEVDEYWLNYLTWEEELANWHQLATLYKERDMDFDICKHFL